MRLLLDSHILLWLLTVAQAQGEAATLVTHDVRLAAYDVPVMRLAG